MASRTLSDELPNMAVGDLMRRWPHAVLVFLRHRMGCPGCLMAPFMTVTEAAIEHRIQPELLVRDLAQAIEAVPEKAEPEKVEP